MNLILDPERLLAAAAISTAWLVWTLHLLRRARKEREAVENASAGKALEATAEEATLDEAALDEGALDEATAGESRPAAPLLVAVASQTGVAAALAGRTAQRLRAAGVAARVESLGRLDENALRSAGRTLFVASTCGEGDAPDEAFGFVRR
ncbi:MAG TPA: flavodoxin domain-containing protein, partial [Burkholderiaceae bacterium]|nr:flavodoxin domain-containing protein [Burkholderiaceae bacterium]